MREMDRRTFLKVAGAAGHIMATACYDDRMVEAAREVVSRRKARTNLLDFTTYTKPDYEVNWHHRILCDYLTRFAFGEIKRLLVFMPPRHGKSELVSRRLPAFIFGLNPDAQIIDCSYAAELANSFNRDAQRIIDAQPYRNLFPSTTLNERNIKNDARGAWKRTTDLFEIVGRRGYMRTAGVGGSITGMGFTHGIIDDPVKGREEADSPVSREKTWEWFQNDFKTRRAANAGILITQTRWHRDDLSGRILAQMVSGESEPWTILCFPAIRGIEENDLDPRGEGEALWPTRLSVEELMQSKASDRRAFEALYQQNPTPDGGTEWPADFFNEDAWFDEWPGQWICKTVAIDPSKGSKSKAGDYTAIVKVMVSEDMVLYVDAEMERQHVDATADAAIRIQRDFHPDVQAIEVNGFQEWVADRIEALANDDSVFVPVLRYDNKENKEARIRRLTPYLSMRRVRFKRRSIGTKLLVEQMMDFPSADHDDGPDAMEMAVRAAVEMCMSGRDNGIRVAGTMGAY